MKLLPSLLLTLCVSLTHAEDAPAKGPRTGQGREKIKEMLLQKFDANKNGTLDADEKAAAMKAMQERRAGSPKGVAPGKGDGLMMARLLQKFDTNKNGVLDPDERASAMQARAGKSGGPPTSGGSSTESGNKFRRPPEAPKASDAK